MEESTPPPLPSSSPSAETAPVTSGAGFGIRAAARIVDTVYIYLIVFLSGIPAGIVLVVLEGADVIAPGWEDRITATNKIFDYAIGFLAGLVYHSITEGMYGASVGKLACKLRVVGKDGGSLRMSQAFRRSLLYYFDALFVGLVGYLAMKESDLQQRHGDRWAHTVVVRSKDAPPASRHGFEIFILSLLLSGACCTLLTTIVLIIHVR